MESKSLEALIIKLHNCLLLTAHFILTTDNRISL